MAIQSLPSAIAGNVSKLPYLAGLALLTWVVYCGFLWIYNIFFHPLRKFPGPIFAAASGIPDAWHSLIGESHRYNLRLHTKYGEIVRITPNELSFASEQGWRDIYMHRQDANGKAVKQLAKSSLRPTPNGVYSIVDAPDAEHARQRKMLSHAFSDKALREQEHLLRSYTDFAVRNLRDDARCNRPADLVQTFNFLTFDIIGELAFGESFHASETRSEHPWFVLFWKVIKSGTKLAMGMRLPIAPLFLPVVPFVAFNAKNMFKFTKEKIQQRIAQGNKDRPDFMALVLKHNTNDGNGITMPEIESTFQLLSIAGSETTATLMSGLMWLVLTSPTALPKLQQEIRSAFTSDSEISLIKIDRLPYLQATIQEALRMYPPSPINMPRRTPPEGIAICGEWIPGNTVVGVPPVAASLSPHNFHEPMKFAPERFLPAGERPAEYDNDSRGASQPFSAGPRNCLGKNLAYAEMKLAISRLMYNFDFEIVNKEKDWFDQKTWGLFDKPPLMVRVKDRTQSN